MRHIQSVLKFLLGILLIVLFLWLIWNRLFNHITTIFNVTVTTERLEFRTVDKNNSRIILNDANVGTRSEILYDKFNGSFELESDVDVIIERIANGHIWVVFKSSKGESVGKLYKGKGGTIAYKAGPYLDFMIGDVKEKAEAGQTFIFRIDGEAKIGRSMGLELVDESKAILRSGQIEMIGSSRFSNHVFQAGTEPLSLGDRLEFEGQTSKGFGFVVINEKPGMEAAYRVEADHAKIYRPGPRADNDGIMIAATFLDRLYHDPFFKGLSFIMGVILFLITTLTFIMDAILFRDNDKAKGKKKKKKKTSKAKES